MTEAAGFNEDFLDMLRALVDSGVEFIVVGAHAMAVHGVPRATGDMDVFLRPTPENAARVMEALHRFGAPTGAHGLDQSALETPDTVYQLGLPPRRIDLMTGLSGLDFAEAHASHITVEVEGMEIPFLGLAALRRNKRASGRRKDALDLQLLAEAPSKDER